MKSEHFSSRSHTSQLRARREKKKPRQINWDRLVYLTLLAIVLIVVAYFLATSALYVTGSGQVVIETMEIRSPNDIEITALYAARGSTVQRDDSLFAYSFMDWQKGIEEAEQTREKVLELEIEIEELNDKRFLKESQIREAESSIEFLENERRQFEQRVRLNISTAFELNAINRDLFNAQSRLTTLNSELTVINAGEERLRQRIETVREDLEERLASHAVHIFRAPADGIVSELLLTETSQAFRRDKILTIQPDNPDVFIRSVFERNDTNHLTAGTMLTIKFDDGTLSEGVIRDTYSARRDIIEHFNQTGLVTADYLIVEIEPANSTEREKWSQMPRAGAETYKTVFRNRNND